MNNLPVNSLDPEAASKKPRLQSQVLHGDTDSDSDDGTKITVTAVSSFNERPLPKIDSRTVKRLALVPAAGHITALFNVAKQNDTVLVDYTVFLVSLTTIWPSQKDIVLNTVASLGSGGLIRMLYRQYALRSQLGQQSNNLNESQYKTQWPPLILLADLYSQTLLTMGDDEFFSEDGATRNPLTMDDLRRFSKQLLNIA
ncbi:hypothetical protein AGABI1DRAFT_63806, partial [Agaricus bisporus var. burnettii JB137-S8]